MTTQRFPAGKNPNSSRFEHLSPLQNLMSLRGKIGRNKPDGCSKITMKRTNKYVDVTVDEETFRIFIRPVDDEWDVLSATYDDKAVIENFSVPFHDDPIAFGSCADCYKQNAHRAIIIYPPPHGPKFHGFEIVEKEGGEITRQVTCGDIPRRQLARSN